MLAIVCAACTIANGAKVLIPLEGPGPGASDREREAVDATMLSSSYINQDTTVSSRSLTAFYCLALNRCLSTLPSPKTSLCDELFACAMNGYKENYRRNLQQANKTHPCSRSKFKGASWNRNDT